MSSKPWYESDNPSRVVRGGSWRLALLISLAVLFVLALSAGVWGLSVATSGVRGAGDVHRQNNSANNRIFSQQHFEDLYAAVVSEDQQLDQAAADAKTHPNDAFYTSTYTGLVQECIRDRNQYNADANKVLLADWQTPDLPHQLDPADPKTDCKPNQ